MGQISRIGVGSHVEGSHSPLISNLNASIKWCVRSNAVGMVVWVAGSHKWNVVFDFDAQVNIVSSKSLIIVRINVGIPFDEEGAAIVTSNVTHDVFVNLLLSSHNIIIVFVFLIDWNTNLN